MMLLIVIDSKNPIEEGVDAFVVPVCSCLCFEADDGAAGHLGSAHGIIEHDPLTSHGACQRTEQRQVILSAKEEYVILQIIWQHAKIIIAVCFSASL